ncbi:hypothetical protein [Rossellomorea sp. DUT-2]|uniref:hypothetical protein n=1 Tax=Rossellomorea sp. DUT-2 TaxID=3412021 RepID=UPI003D186BC2
MCLNVSRSLRSDSISSIEGIIPPNAGDSSCTKAEDLVIPVVTVKKVFKKVGEVDKPTVLKETVKILIEKEENSEQSKRKKKKSSAEINHLGQLMNKARKQKKSVFEWYLDKDIIKSPLDESWKDDEHAALVSHSVS